MQNKTMRLIIISLLLMSFSIVAICLRVSNQHEYSQHCIFGGYLKQAPKSSDIDIYESSLSRQTISIISEKMSDKNETFFRPSRLPAINNSFPDINSLTQTFVNDTVPPSLIDNPENAIINYFSVLQQASTLTENKNGGFGNVGYSKTPYPVAYNFLSQNNKKSMPYDEYLNSFEGIGHINLLKIIPIITNNKNEYKYFIEL